MTKNITTWPPNYTIHFASRVDRLNSIRNKPDMLLGALEYYKDPARWVEFIEHWLITYDPRNNKKKTKPVIMPFILFPRQKDLIEFLISCWRDSESGLLEKSRDMGATWLSVAFSICMWLFCPGSSIGWGSRKQELVDKIGDPDSIFEKLRMTIKYLPREFMPAGWNENVHCSYMKLINPANGSSITGEIGDNIGRGGRKSIYFKDESAHYERPEKIEAALGDNTDVQIDISSVNGTANVFARRRKSGVVWNPGCTIPEGEQRVFIMDWRDHPEKTQEWYDKRRAKAEREGLLHIFAQEVDRDYASAVEGVLIPNTWVQAAVDLHTKINVPLDDMMVGTIYSALDVADEGRDLNAQACRQGITLFDLDKWAQGDTGQTANKAIHKCSIVKANELQYDCIGIGAGIKSETNRLKRDNLLRKHLKIIGWNASKGVLHPKRHIIKDDKTSPLNKDLYSNLKSQGWWNLRTRFEKTYKMVNQNTTYPVSDLICIKSDIDNFDELISELSQPTYSHNSSGQITINKKPDGTRSPNLADSVNMVYWPVPEIEENVGIVGGCAGVPNQRQEN